MLYNAEMQPNSTANAAAWQVLKYDNAKV